ncbi:MAG: hypothetical protein JXR35_09570 [Rhodobacteraceae bacterium]|nr:hypothetical protein [Paracoccaceae bacterium]
MDSGQGADTSNADPDTETDEGSSDQTNADNTTHADLIDAPSYNAMVGGFT